MVWKVAEGFPVRIPDQAGMAEVPLGRAPNPKIAPTPTRHTHCVLCAPAVLLHWFVMMF